MRSRGVGIPAICTSLDVLEVTNRRDCSQRLRRNTGQLFASHEANGEEEEPVQQLSRANEEAKKEDLSTNCLERSERLRKNDGATNSIEQSQRLRRRDRLNIFHERSERLRRKTNP